MTEKKSKLIIVLGPTAVGKTDYSIELAKKYGSPIISCDSRQIYREMRIGTAVPTAAQLSAVQHYFIGTKSVVEPYTAGQFERDALELINKLFDQEGHETLVMTGGTMFYIDALCNGLDDFPEAEPELRAKLLERVKNEGTTYLAEELKALDPETYYTIDLQNSQRVVRALEVCLISGKPFSSFKTHQSRQRNFEVEKIGLNRPREVLYDRINRRVLQMMDEGLLEEARSLIQYRDLPALQTVGYKELFAYFDGINTLEEAVAFIQSHTRNYAKRQLTWWKRDKSINWIEL
ncbi:MAG: tRNA (adenosine(37)-N6)-dimethylallyltransferase MiaA [Bacteroidales bacterium]|nr:tRNA (adenosine(37)-N6)-dimethylallyltransferase MiaA [Bacteroidales bacterium]